MRRAIAHHEKEEEEKNLGQKDSDREQRQPAAVRSDVVVRRERHVPPAEEQRRHQRTRRHHVRVLGDEKERELHRAVFGVITRDELRFGFRQVEWQPVGLGERRDHENEKGDRQIDDVPSAPGLLVDDGVEADVAGEQQYRNRRHAHRDLVGHHLRTRAQPAEQRVLVVR